ncbi:NB-ARC - like 10 [Theobroma cacao]|nr:NB-ARC - like 10 [Theobroma cacao]
MEEIINEINLRQVAELVKALSPFSILQDLRLFRLPELKSIYLDALPFPCMKSIRNRKSSHKFSKRVAKRLHDVKDLNFKGAFEEVATAVPPALVVERPSDSAIGLESMLNTVWCSLKEKHVGIIGLYGLGGVGKTRLLTEINNKIGVWSGGFDVVIWVVVSKGFYIEKVQDDIAKRIGLISGTWNDKTTEEKAIEIFGSLREKKFVLLFDDIWERVDLSKVGIPSPTQANGSKLIFTTRSIKVCGQMRAHKNIEVTCLAEERLGNCLKNILFSEDFYILKERLIDCWIGEGFLDEHDNISQARNQGHRIIGSLIHACLLEEVNDWYVKMHDVIRDMSLWITCKCEAEKWKFFVQAGYQLTKVPEVGK